MEKNSIHKKLYISLIVASTLITVGAFNEKNVQASETKEEIPQISHNGSEEEKLEEEVKEETEIIDEDIEKSGEIPSSPEFQDEDIRKEEKFENSKREKEDGNSEIETLDDNLIDIMDIRNASMSIFQSKSSSTPHYTTSFIEAISPIAIELGKEYGLYPSVITAQAALESGWGGKSPALPEDYVLSLPPNYNLFGVKGDYNGESVAVKTKEYDKNKGEYIEVVDYFRKYPSYRESILDYTKKMRYNLTTTDPYFYSGVWIENTSSYRDATAFLTGRYATDPEYGDKLNRIITSYNLTQYDDIAFETVEEDNSPETVLDSHMVANYASLKSNISIYNKPAYQMGYKVVLNSDDLSSLKVVIKEQVRTNKQTWVKIESSGQNLGWVRLDDITFNNLEIIEDREVAYKATITNPAINIYSRPAWTEGNQLSAISSNYLGREITVKEEIVTEEAIYAKVEINGELLGWINVSGLTQHYHSILETKEVAYKAVISNPSINIYSRPAWTEGNQLIVKSADNLGQKVIVKEEVVTEEATYAKIEVDNRILGWINIRGLNKEYNSILDTREVAYNAIISDSVINIYSQPAWTKGSVLTAKTVDHLGTKITVKEQILTEEATYAKVEIDGETLGWININGLTNNFYPILETKSVVYNATISKPSINIYSRPAWTEGNFLTAKSSDYLGVDITVREEIVTEEATYARVDIKGKTLGWINTNGLSLNYENIINTHEVAYNATVTNARMGIYSQPAWTEGNKLVAESAQYLGQDIIVKEEIVTGEATYAKVDINGGIIGWINVGGLTPKYSVIKEKRSTSYGATIARNLSNIYNTPAWTSGNYLTAYTSDYIGTRLVVKEEIVTEEAVYALITINGKNLGWLNTNSLRKNPIVYLDAGHGGSESGAVSGGIYEKDLNLLVTKKVRDLLEAKGYTVVMAREDDRYLSLSHRAQEANQAGADIFVSIHHNAFNGNSHGIETFYYNEAGSTNNPKANDPERIQDSKKMAEEVQKELIKETGAYDRGVKRANFHVVRETEMPSILVEGGFVDNAVERAKLVLDSYQQKLANAIAKGIEKFFSIWN